MSKYGESELGEQATEKLKVLHIAGWYPSKKNPVAGSFVREHVKATALYNEVVVLYPEGVDNDISGLVQIMDKFEDGIRTLRLRYRKSPIPKTTYMIYLYVIYRAFRKLVGEGFIPDVIHAHVYSAGVPAAMLGIRYDIPLVLTEHSTAFPRGQLRGLELMKARFTFKHAVFSCPVSDYLRKHIEAYGIRARFCVIPNVVDTALFSPPNRDAVEVSKKKRLLLVALLDPKKGIPYLLEALDSLRKRRDDFKLDVVGDGPNRAEYEGMVQSLGLQDFVSFHGLKTREEVAVAMKDCDIFILPSLVETFGVVLIEALACGKPIIASNIGGPNEIVTEDAGRLVPPGDSAALAQTIDFMLDHHRDFKPDEIARRAEERYSYAAVGKMYGKLYRMTRREPQGFWKNLLKKLMRPFDFRTWYVYNRVKLWSRILRNLKGTSIRDEAALCASALIDIIWCMLHPRVRRNLICRFPCTVCFKDYGVSFHIRKRSDDIYSVLPFREGDIHEAILGSLDDGDVFVDVGSNIGYYSLLAARKVGKAGRVIAIEANPRNAEQLRRNISLNAADNIEVIEAAAWSESGRQGRIRFRNGFFGQAYLERDNEVQTEDKMLEKTRLTRIDDICKDFDLIKIMKIDVEGAEYEALKGAQKTLPRTEMVVIEISRDYAQIFDFLSRAGYMLKESSWSSNFICQRILHSERQ